MDEMECIKRLGTLEGTIRFQLDDPMSQLNTIERISVNLTGGWGLMVQERIKELRESLKRGLGEE